MSSLPRLSVALRAFANVSSNKEKSASDLQRELINKRQLLAKQHTDTVSWKRLKEIITKEADVPQQEVDGALRELTQYVKAIGTVIHLYLKGTAIGNTHVGLMTVKRFQSKVYLIMFQLSTKCEVKFGKQISVLITSFDHFKAI